MAEKNPKDAFKEYRTQAVKLLERAGASSASLNSVRAAESSSALISAINRAMMQSGARGREKNELVVIKDFLKALNL